VSGSSGPQIIVSVAGVGGQGVMSLARWIGMAAHQQGVAVSVSQLQGMSQRGGVEEATVTLDGVPAAGGRSRPGHILIALELLEALRALERLGPIDVLLGNQLLIPPPALPPGRTLPAPAEVIEVLRHGAGQVHLVTVPPPSAVPRTASRLPTGVGATPAEGRPAAANVVLLGALAALSVLPVPAARLLDAVTRERPQEAAAHREAFVVGGRLVHLGQDDCS
jgi:Pyruvate/2-oxoacid:ferredoxin oxidoreductase gamma subunit